LGFVEQSWEAVVSGIVEVSHPNLPQLVQPKSDTQAVIPS